MEWLFWIGGALLLVVIETVTADLTFLMIAGGALGGGLTSFLGGPLWAQVVVFACVSTLLLFAVRPWAKRRLAATTPQMKTNVDALIGRSATTITAVDDGGGRVRLGGEEGSARLAPAAQGGVTRLEAGVSGAPAWPPSSRGRPAWRPEPASSSPRSTGPWPSSPRRLRPPMPPHPDSGRRLRRPQRFRAGR